MPPLTASGPPRRAGFQRKIEGGTNFFYHGDTVYPDRIDLIIEEITARMVFFSGYEQTGAVIFTIAAFERINFSGNPESTGS